MDIVENIKKVIGENNLIINNKINVAVSGGADSVALIRILHLLKINCTIVHINHKLRGLDSDNDQKFVENIGNELNIPVLTYEENIEDYSKINKQSLEMSGREIRHKFFSTLSNKYIALAHHADDQAENFIIKASKGSSLSGLGGMPVVQKLGVLTIIRPLINLSHKDLCEWLINNNWTWREDKTNQDNIFLRNRIRNNIIPIIKKELNTDFIKTLNRNMNLIREEDFYLDQLTSNYSIETIKDAPLVLRRRWIRIWLHNNQISRIGYETTNQIANGLTNTKGTRFYNVNKNWKVVIEYGIPSLIKFDKNNVSPKWNLNIEYGNGWKKDVGKRAGILPAKASISAKKVGDLDLRVRCIQPGDQFQPLGMLGHKKLQDILIDQKVPQRERALIPVVTCKNTIVWIPGYSIANGWEVSKQTDSSLHLYLTNSQI